MAIFANNQSFGVPGVTDTIAESTVGPFTADTNTYIDIDTTETTALSPVNGMRITPGTTFPGLTTANSTYYFHSLDSTTGTGVVLDSTACTYNVMYARTNQGAGVTEWTEEWRFNGDNFVRRTGGARFQIGSSQFSGTDTFNYTMILGEDGLTLTAYGDGPLILHTAGADPATSNLQGLVFEGNTTGQLSPRIGQFGFVPSNVAVNGGETPTGYGYSVRIVHQPARSGVPADSTDNPNGFCLYTNTDLRNVLIGGRTAGAAFEDSEGGFNGDAKRSTWQMNHSTAIWFVNPVWTPEAALPADNDSLLISTHRGQPPTAADPSEVRTFTLHKPLYIDSDDSTRITDARVRYDGEARAFPQNYIDNDVPDSLTDNEGPTSGSTYNGYMVQDHRLLITSAIGLPENALIPRPNGHTFNARSFTHDVVYDNTVTPTLATALTTVEPEEIEAASLAVYLNGHDSAADAPTSVINWADTFAVLRKSWYDQTSLTSVFPVRGVGTSLVFDAGVTMGSPVDADLAGIGIPSVFEAKNFVGDINTFDFNTQTVNWFGQGWATGMTISGGLHTDLGANTFSTLLNGVTWIAENTPTIRIPEVIAFGSFEAIFGNVTGDFNIDIPLGEAVEITASAEQQAQILNSDDFIAGTGTSDLNFTRFIDVSEFTPADNKQVQLFNADGEFLVTLRHDGSDIRMANLAGGFSDSNRPILVNGHFRITERQINTVSTGTAAFNDRMLLVSSSDISIPQIRYVDTIAATTIGLQFITDPSVATTAPIPVGLSVISVSPDVVTGSYDDGVLVITEGFGDATAPQSRVLASDVRNTVQYAQWISAQFPYDLALRDGTDLSNVFGVNGIQQATADFSASSFFEVPGTWRFQPNQNGPIASQSYSLLAKNGSLDDLLLIAEVIVPASTTDTTVEVNGTLNSTDEIDYSRVNLEAENAARTAIDGTIMNMVDETHNASNYLLTNGVDVDGGGGYDRLIGIKPRAANFNPATNY